MKNMKTRHLLHPKWRELEDICNKIESLKNKAYVLRKEIDDDLDKYTDDELNKLTFK